MKLSAKMTPPNPMTRREFVARTLAMAAVMAGAPAFLRGQNLNNKLDIAFIACGGRGRPRLHQPAAPDSRRAFHPTRENIVLAWFKKNYVLAARYRLQLQMPLQDFRAPF